MRAMDPDVRAYSVRSAAAAAVSLAACLALLLLEYRADVALARALAYLLMAIGAAGFLVAATYGFAARGAMAPPERPWRPARFWWGAAGVLLAWTLYGASQVAVKWMSGRFASPEADRWIVQFGIGFGAFNLVLLVPALWNLARKKRAV